VSEKANKPDQPVRAFTKEQLTEHARWFCRRDGFWRGDEDRRVFVLGTLVQWIDEIWERDTV
jgi:hypothetical protein